MSSYGIKELADECRRNREELARERRRSIWMLLAILLALVFLVYTHGEMLLWLINTPAQGGAERLPCGESLGVDEPLQEDE